MKTELAKPVVEYVNNAFIKVGNNLENQRQCMQCVKISTEWHINLNFEKVGLWRFTVGELLGLHFRDRIVKAA